MGDPIWQASTQVLLEAGARGVVTPVWQASTHVFLEAGVCAVWKPHFCGPSITISWRHVHASAPSFLPVPT